MCLITIKFSFYFIISKIIGFSTIFLQQQEIAKALWDNKSSSAANKAAFEEVKGVLKSMTVGNMLCNYCENDRAEDIEHIFPKGFYPSKAFVWENYILACKCCNTTFKSDKFAIFETETSHHKKDLIRGNEPENNDNVLIDLRKEDPTEFLRLNLYGGTFFFDAIYESNTREYTKADYTITLLELNYKETLVAARQKAASNYIGRIKDYIAVKNATTFEALDLATNGFPASKHLLDFEDEKKRILENIINTIKTSNHPTVWFELKRQRYLLSHTCRLFEEAPEALNW